METNQSDSISFIQTLRLIRSDFARTSELMNMGKSPGHLIFLAITPSIVGLALYRLSRWCYVKRLRFLAWGLWVINLYLTGADIVPTSSIGEGCFIGHPVGTIISGKLGKRVVMYGVPMIGGGRGEGDVGAGPQLPVIGDDVVIGIRSTILGPIRIGDGAIIGAGALVLRDVPDGATVSARPATQVKGGEAA